MINFTKPQFWGDLPYILLARVMDDAAIKCPNFSVQDFYEGLDVDTLDKWAKEELNGHRAYIRELENFLDIVS